MMIYLNNDYTVLVGHARWFDNHYSPESMQNVAINGRNMIMAFEIKKRLYRDEILFLQIGSLLHLWIHD
jgi:hypothetical protein